MLRRARCLVVRHPAVAELLLPERGGAAALGQSFLVGDALGKALGEGLARVLALDVRPLVHVSFC